MNVIVFKTTYRAQVNFGPFLHQLIYHPYDDTKALEKVLKSTPNIAGF
jgi:hypothetical protein